MTTPLGTERRPNVWRRIIWCHAACTSLAAAQAAAQQVDVIRGRVTSDSGRALVGVTVIATMAPTLLVQQAITDSTGRYEIRFSDGTGDYLIYSAPSGFRAFRRRVTRSTSTALLVVDIPLSLGTTTLPVVRTNAARPRPMPDFGSLGDPTGAEEKTTGLFGSLSPDRLGDLAAMAATIPGIMTTPDGGIVAFGLANQTSTTYNGTSFAGNSIPPDMMATVRVTTTAYDPSVGGFGAARVNVEATQGGRVAKFFGRSTLDIPAMQFGDAVSRNMGQRFTRYQFSGNADGPFGERDMWYNLGFRATRRSADAVSLADANPGAFARVGISRDSVIRLQQIASSLGVPFAQSRIPSARTDNAFSFLGRIDRYADPRRYGKMWNNAFSLTAFVDVNDSDAPGAGLFAAPEYGARSASRTGQLIGEWLHETDRYATRFTTSATASRNSREPYVDLPSARVRIDSRVDGADPTARSVAFGGYPLASTATSGSWETVGYLTFYPAAEHFIKVYGRSLVDWATSRSRANERGTFIYNSLEDLAGNRPSSFTRTVASGTRSAAAWRGALSVGDLWQLTPRLQLQPGLRIESNRALARPKLNPALSAAFGISNDAVPASLHASPRFGFAWTRFPSLRVGRVGSATTGFVSLPVPSVLSGGIGEFRTESGAGSLLGPIGSTGLTDSDSQVSCFGPGVPAVDWRAYAASPSALPTECAVSAPATWVDDAPPVELFDPSYSLARSWRANLNWGSAYKRFRYGISGVYSWNVDQPGFVNLNFANASRFTIPSEAGRPIFVSPAAITPGTGIVAPGDVRHTAEFAEVIERVSDLRSTARQATLTVAPEMENKVFTVSYTLSDVRSTSRGFEATTFGSPFALERARSPYDIRHRITVQAGYAFPVGIGLSTFWSVQSGAPYTPVVGSDINGDGFANDRAFVFDPAQTADTTVQRGMRALLSSAPLRARRCLLSQRGKPSGGNSCEGPWTVTANAAITTKEFHVLDGRLASASLNLANPLAGFDRLLHGTDGLRGWGFLGAPDPILYTVRSFDPATKTFRYSVNPHFGDTRTSSTLLRSPFRVTLSVRLELGPALRRREFDRFREMNAIRMNHTKAPADSLQRRLRSLVRDGYQQLIGWQDSLLLTAAQIDSLQRADSNYVRRADVIWRPLAAYLANLGTDDIDMNSIMRRVDEARARVWAIQRSELVRMMAPLTEPQRALARFVLGQLIESANRLPPPYISIF